MDQSTLPTPSELDGCDILSDVVVGHVVHVAGNPCPLDFDERRSRERFPIYCCMQLLPLGRDGNVTEFEATTVVGKDISANGISFSHEDPLNCKRLIVSIELGGIEPIGVEAEVVWSRQSPIGLYESGCRLIRKVTGQAFL